MVSVVTDPLLSRTLETVATVGTVETVGTVTTATSGGAGIGYCFSACQQEEFICAWHVSTL